MTVSNELVNTLVNLSGDHATLKDNYNLLDGSVNFIYTISKEGLCGDSVGIFNQVFHLNRGHDTISLEYHTTAGSFDEVINISGSYALVTKYKETASGLIEISSNHYALSTQHNNLIHLREEFSLNGFSNFPISSTLHEHDTNIASHTTQIGNHTSTIRGLDGSFLLITGDNKMAGNLNMNGNKIINLDYPNNPTDATNKQYVDHVAHGIRHYHYVQYATTDGSNITGPSFENANGVVIDSCNIELGDHILIKDQDNSISNGVYEVINVGSNSTRLSRREDMSGIDISSGAFFFVEYGLKNHATGWVLHSPDGSTNFTIGDNSLNFTKISSMLDYVGKINGNITIIGNVIDLSINSAIDMNNKNISNVGMSTTSDWLTVTNNIIAIGHGRPYNNMHGGSSISIGSQNKPPNQHGEGNISIGHDGGSNQYNYCIAIGFGAGSHQGTLDQGRCIAIGLNAGELQAYRNIAIGNSAGGKQEQYSIAIGYKAGNWQDEYCIAIGLGGDSDVKQYKHSIILNAQANALTASKGGFYVAPVREEFTNIGKLLYYTDASEIVQSNITFSGDTIDMNGQNINNVDNLTTSSLTVNSDEIAIGSYAGVTSQQTYAIAIGRNAGNTSQKKYAIAIGSYAGQNSQQIYAIAIGRNAGDTSQKEAAIAIGLAAGQTSQQNNSIAIGLGAGGTSQQSYAIAIGTSAGDISQQSYAIAIGQYAGETSQQNNSIAIGRSAGQTSQQNNSIAIGLGAGGTSQQSYAIAIGTSAGDISQQSYAIAIGQYAGETSQQNNSIAIGRSAGQTSQQNNSIAIGLGAGGTSQQSYAIAIGTSAGDISQQSYAIAIGRYAGENSQKESAIAIGLGAGETAQQNNSIAIGTSAGETSQQNNSIAIGTSAGQYYLGNSSIAIGKLAGDSMGSVKREADKMDNVIILNATGLALNSEGEKRFYVAPVREAPIDTGNLLYYTDASEIVQSNITFSGGTIDMNNQDINNVSSIKMKDGGTIGNNTYNIGFGTTSYDGTYINGIYINGLKSSFDTGLLGRYNTVASESFLAWSGTAAYWPAVASGGVVLLNTAWPISTLKSNNYQTISWSPIMWNYGTKEIVYHYTGSDRKLKTNIEPFRRKLDIVNKLNPVYFNWIKSGAPDHGFIAQELELLIPGIIRDDKDASGEITKVYEYEAPLHFIPVLTKAIQDLDEDKNKEVAELKSENAELKGSVSTLKSQITDILARLTAAGIA